MRLVVLGAGESGVGAALLGKDKGWEVFVSDAGEISPPYKVMLEEEAITWEENKHTLSELLKADLVVKSPGIPYTVEVVKELKKAGIKIIDEIEFAVQYTNKPIVAVTGSNGKTTTAKLLSYILDQAGLEIGLGGNIRSEERRVGKERRSRRGREDRRKKKKRKRGHGWGGGRSRRRRGIA